MKTGKVIEKLQHVSKRITRREVIKYIISCILFGLLPITTKNSTAGPLANTFIRVLVGTFTLMVIFCCSKFRATLWDYTKLQLVFLVISGVCIGLTYLILADTTSKFGTITVTLTYSLGPGLLLVVAPFLFKEVTFTISKTLGFLICTLGIFLLDYQWIFNPEELANFSDVFIGAIFSVVIVYCNRQLEDISGLENAMFQMIIAFFVIFVVYVWKHDLYFNLNESDSWWLILGGIISTALPIYLYLSSIDELRADTIAFVGYLRPITTVTVVVTLYGETFGPNKILGAICILGGVAIANFFRRKNLPKTRTF